MLKIIVLEVYDEMHHMCNN